MVRAGHHGGGLHHSIKQGKAVVPPETPICWSWHVPSCWTPRRALASRTRRPSPKKAGSSHVCFSTNDTTTTRSAISWSWTPSKFAQAQAGDRADYRLTPDGPVSMWNRGFSSENCWHQLDTPILSNSEKNVPYSYYLLTTIRRRHFAARHRQSTT